MSRKKIYILVAILVLIVFAVGLLNSDRKKDIFAERAKISLRDIGNQLLLANNDSTSLVQPVIQITQSKYQLSFQKQLSFDPTDLVSITRESLQKGELPENYLVEVLECETQEVAYSYEMKNNEELSIIPCGGRILPENCYTIDFRFTDITSASVLSTGNKLLLLVFMGAVFLFLYEVFFSKRKANIPTEDVNPNYTEIGSFQFYPGQNKLVKKPNEINLSRKECELLEIFVANLNQIVSRDELTKKVWEDHGVFVGRSLDTYVSKLRKKLQEDETVQLVNVHGVGYKLEIVG
ncbi:winged helix-turn-helix domain-containing protein [Ulvibacter sp. MAR_2010_11]|uniref:winged helix-turn-helix domain-containing protein n=1 Tax=Ulvibacter sp. MAR_2010_11 TaxID=1250229 RepID=UPI001E5912FF|nr:winged helix-turn-helix domain-containing protein [Ulvibacter sp. MAR_2010_11]